MSSVQFFHIGKKAKEYLNNFILEATSLSLNPVFYRLMEENSFLEINWDEYKEIHESSTTAILDFNEYVNEIFDNIKIDDEIRNLLKLKGDKEGRDSKSYELGISIVFIDLKEYEYTSWIRFEEKFLKKGSWRIAVLLLPDKLSSLDEVHDYKKVLWNIQNSFNLTLGYLRNLKDDLNISVLLTLFILLTPGVVNIDGADLKYFCQGGLLLIPMTSFAEGEGDLPSSVMRDLVLKHLNTVEWKSVKGAAVTIFPTEDIPLKDIMRVIEGVKRLVSKRARIIMGINIEKKGVKKIGLLILLGIIPNELLMHLYATEDVISSSQAFHSVHSKDTGI